VSRPAWARPTDQLSFGVVTTGDPAATTVQVEVFSSLDSVEELEESADGDVGVRLSRTPPAPVDSLPPGPDGSRIVTLQVAPEPVDGLTTQLVEPGVHPVVISLLGADGEVLDEVRTPLVRLGGEDDPWEAPELAVLLDIAAPPSLQPDGSRTLPRAVLRRLVHAADLLAAHPDLDLTLAVVPDTVDALSTLPDPEAATILDQLAGRDVLAAPYVRLPATELAAHRLEGLIEPLVVRGVAVLADRLGGEPRAGTWDGELPLDDDAGRILARLGYDRVVVPAPEEDEDDRDERGDEPAPLADSGPRRLRGAGPLLGLVADPVLSAELAEPLPDRPDASHVALARYLLRPAEGDPGDRTGNTARDRDDDREDAGSTVLVRPGMLAERSTLAGLLDLLDDPEAPVRVGGLDLVDPTLDADPDEDEPAEPVTWPRGEGPDLRATARRVLALAGPLDSFARMLSDRSPLADDLRLQVATAVAADTTRSGREAALDAVEGALDDAFGAIRLSGQTDLNLTSRQGTLPVTVENANPFAVDVVIRVRSDRLTFPGERGDPRGRERAIPATVGAQDLLRIDVPVNAQATGSVPVFVELLSIDGDVPLDSRRLNVRSTAVSGVGLVISVGALVVLLSWWIRHSRAVRRGRRGPSGTADQPME